MKKKKIKSLNLNKNSVSDLNDLSKITGGSNNDICYSLSACEPTCAFTCGNCIQTWADPGCLTGIGWLCPNK